MELAGDIVWSIISKGILGSLGFGFMGCLLGVAIMFVLRAKGLLKRSRGISKVLVISYWIFVPIIFAWSFTILKGLTYAENALETTANTVILKFEEKTYEPFHKYVTENVEKYTGEMILPSNEELVKGFFDGPDRKEDDWILEGIMFLFLEVAENEAEEAIADYSFLEKEDVQEVRTFGASQIDGLFHGTFSKLRSLTNVWIKGIIRPYFWGTVLIWILLMVFPIIEIIIARKRRNASLALTSPAPSPTETITGSERSIEEISDL